MKDLSVVLIVLAIIAGSFWVLAEFGGLSIRDHFGGAIEINVSFMDEDKIDKKNKICGIPDGNYRITIPAKQSPIYIRTVNDNGEMDSFSIPADRTRNQSYAMLLNGLGNGDVVDIQGGCAIVGMKIERELIPGVNKGQFSFDGDTVIKFFLKKN